LSTGWLAKLAGIGMSGLWKRWKLS